MTPEQIWSALEDVKDPEIPVVSLVEMGMVRTVTLDGDAVTVTLTPTFAGCPAQHVMAADVEARLRALGVARVNVQWVLSPPWTSDWITETARAKLKAFGLAPPPQHNGLIQIILNDEAPCPYCGSANTQLKNNFGPTLCRAIYYCNHCQQPFEQFKAL